jgi:DNA mismatch repair protein MutL
MSKIRVLPEALANKIAAGEVVERPASVVKELLENAIDAGSLSIDLDVEAGGKRLIRIRDDGEGMTSDDALLAFERHATSKLHRADDLLEITTLGFRGEALPSIASVSRLLLETRHESSEVGTSVEVLGARVNMVGSLPRSCGTTVTVRDLFFNIPARKKFLKAESTELSHIVNVVTQYALAHPEARFVLKSSDTELFHFQVVKDLRERVFQVFGKELLDQLIEVRDEIPIFNQEADETREPQERKDRVRIEGFISKPEVHKLNRNSLYFFVNRRMVRDKIIMHALNEAYRNILPANVFPVVLLFVEMPCREVDVNVHPSKTEVRFRRQSLIHDFLRDAVRKALMQARPQHPFPVRRSAFAPADLESPFDAPVTEHLFSDSPTTPLELTAQAPPPVSMRFHFNPETALSIAAPSPNQEQAKIGGLPQEGPRAQELLPETPEAVPFAVSASSQFSAPESPQDIVPLGQIDNSFIVASDRGALLIIDQHVAHERILFEKVLNQRSQGKVETQQLLLPIVVELNPRQQVILENITPELRACGFEVEPFGRKTIAIKSAPAGLMTEDIQKLMNELLEGLEKEVQAVSLMRLREKIAASIACHAAIKVNTKLEHPKMLWLIDELLKTQHPMSCPHGRPIILRYEKNEILRAFKRI